MNDRSFTTPEVILVPTPEELRREAYDVWSTVAHRSATRTAQVLAQRYGELSIATPGEPAIRNWVRREGWVERADRELHETYPRQVREFALGQWRLLQAMQQRVLDAVCGGRALSKEETRLFEVLVKGAGWGAFGFNAGGQITLQFETPAEDLSQLSTDERLRRMRSLYVEANTGNA